MIWLIIIALIFFFVDWRVGAILTVLAVVGYIMSVSQQSRRGRPLGADWGTPPRDDEEPK